MARSTATQPLGGRHRPVPHSSSSAGLAHRVRRLYPVVLIWSSLAVCLAGCSSFGGSGRAASRLRPSAVTPEVKILAPISGQTITGTAARVQLLARGARLVNKVGQPNVAGECHLRVWVDAEDLSAPSMVQTATTFDLTGLAPGLHHLIVELRQNDDMPLPGAPTDGERDTPVHKHVHFDMVSAFARIQAEIFTPTCATAGCHVSGGAAPMALSDAKTSHFSLVDVLASNDTARAANKKRVVPGHPEQSFLVRKLTRELQYGEGDPMPQDAPALAPDQIDLIRLWISQGAVPAP